MRLEKKNVKIAKTSLRKVSKRCPDTLRKLHHCYETLKLLFEDNEILLGRVINNSIEVIVFEYKFTKLIIKFKQSILINIFHLSLEASSSVLNYCKHYL